MKLLSYILRNSSMRDWIYFVAGIYAGGALVTVTWVVSAWLN